MPNAGQAQSAYVLILKVLMRCNIIYKDVKWLRLFNRVRDEQAFNAILANNLESLSHMY